MKTARVLRHICWWVANDDGMTSSLLRRRGRRELGHGDVLVYVQKDLQDP